MESTNSSSKSSSAKSSHSKRPSGEVMEDEDYPVLTAAAATTSHSPSASMETDEDEEGTKTPAPGVEGAVREYGCVGAATAFVCFNPNRHKESRPTVYQLQGPFFSDSMRGMKALFEAGKLTDVTLRLEDCSGSAGGGGDVAIPCHRVVLAGASLYFRAMFTSGMREEAVPEIRLHCLTPLALRRLVNFAYTGEITLCEANVCEILSAAIMLQINAVVEACTQFLESQLHVTNALGLLEFANSIGCLELAQKTQVYVDRNFSEIVKHDEMVGLSAESFFGLIERNELSVRSEAEVYNAVVRWVNAAASERRPLLSAALSRVRLHALPPDFIRNQIKNCSLLISDPAARAHMQCVLNDLLLHKNLPATFRGGTQTQVIYSAGGYLRYSLSIFEAYNCRTDTWRRLPDLPSPRSGLAAVTVRGCVFLVGGRNNNSEMSNMDAPHMDCYDPTTNKWHTCAPMSVPRNRVGVGVIDDMIYAIGGLTHTMHHRTAERYDIDEDLWTPIAPMHYPRIGLGVAVVNRLLYAVGGFDGERRLSTVERYDPDSDTWSEVASLSRPRSGAGIVEMDHYIYAVGGYDSHSQLRTVERYNVEQNLWEFMPPMLHPRSALSATVFDGMIWVFGGYDGSEFLSSVEKFDPARQTWSKVAVMPCGKSGHAVITSREPIAAIAAEKAESPK